MYTGFLQDNHVIYGFLYFKTRTHLQFTDFLRVTMYSWIHIRTDIINYF